MRAFLPRLLLPVSPLLLVGGVMLVVAPAAPGCITAGSLPAGSSSTLYLPDGGVLMSEDGGATVSCAFEELDTFSCSDTSLAPPVWTAQCVDDDDCRTRTNNTSTRAGCTETTQYQDVQELTTTCQQWQNTGGSLPVLDSGPAPVCAPGSVSSFVPTWHPPRAKANVCTRAQIADYAQCLTDALSELNPPSCAEWSGTLSTSDQACYSCMTSNQSDADYGPFVLLPTALVINVPGCIALGEGKTDGSGCGGALMDDEECTRASCLPTCQVGTSYLDSIEANCEQQANVIGNDAGVPGGTCASYAQNATCASKLESGDAGPASACFGIGPDAGTNSVFVNVGMIFCGGQ